MYSINHIPRYRICSSPSVARLAGSTPERPSAAYHGKPPLVYPQLRRVHGDGGRRRGRTGLASRPAGDRLSSRGATRLLEGAVSDWPHHGKRVRDPAGPAPRVGNTPGETRPAACYVQTGPAHGRHGYIRYRDIRFTSNDYRPVKPIDVGGFSELFDAGHRRAALERAARGASIGPPRSPGVDEGHLVRE